MYFKYKNLSLSDSNKCPVLLALIFQTAFMLCTFFPSWILLNFQFQIMSIKSCCACMVNIFPKIILLKHHLTCIYLTMLIQFFPAFTAFVERQLFCILFFFFCSVPSLNMFSINSCDLQSVIVRVLTILLLLYGTPMDKHTKSS